MKCISKNIRSSSGRLLVSPRSFPPQAHKSQWRISDHRFRWAFQERSILRRCLARSNPPQTWPRKVRSCGWSPYATCRWSLWDSFSRFWGENPSVQWYPHWQSEESLREALILSSWFRSWVWSWNLSSCESSNALRSLNFLILLCLDEMFSRNGDLVLIFCVFLNWGRGNWCWGAFTIGSERGAHGMTKSWNGFWGGFPNDGNQSPAHGSLSLGSSARFCGLVQVVDVWNFIKGFTGEWGGDIRDCALSIGFQSFFFPNFWGLR